MQIKKTIGTDMKSPNYKDAKAIVSVARTPRLKGGWRLSSTQVAAESGSGNWLMHLGVTAPSGACVVSPHPPPMQYVDGKNSKKADGTVRTLRGEGAA
jgi:hypothetical protein